MILTRRESGELQFFNTLEEALSDAKDKSVWKISFSFGESRVRLIRGDDSPRFYLEMMPDFIAAQK